VIPVRFVGIVDKEVDHRSPEAFLLLGVLGGEVSSSGSGMTRASDDRPRSRRRDPGSEGLDCTYNLFRRSGCESLVCAVPADRPVPGFLSGQGWLFGRSLHPLEGLPSGFLVKPASESIRFNGFYLFYLAAELVPNDGWRGSTSDVGIRAHVRTILRQISATSES
jgi:hypothetical protein